MTKNKTWSLEEDRILKEIYPSGGSLECVKALGRTKKSVQSRAHLLGLKVLKGYRGQIVEKAKAKSYDKYAVNPNQFITEHTPITAYILGLLWADGCIGSGNTSVSFKTTKPDDSHFTPVFKSTGEWRVYSYNYKNQPAWSPSVTIVTTNRPLHTFLSNCGYYSNNDTSADKILSAIPEEYSRYWFLGLVDGDGCWYFNDKHKLRQFQVTSRIDQDWTFMEKLFESLSIEYSIDRRCVDSGSRRRSNIRIFGKQSLRLFGDYIYGDPTGLALPRKFEKWKVCIA